MSERVTDTLLHNEQTAPGRDRILILHALLIKARAAGCLQGERRPANTFGHYDLAQDWPGKLFDWWATVGCKV